MVIIFIITYGLTAFIYLKLGQQPSPFAAYLINAFIGLVLCFVTLMILSRAIGPKQYSQRMGLFAPIYEAMGKIAKGDFTVRIEGDYHHDGIAGELAKNVNSMALELHHIETMRQEFISNVSHETQSPLTSIRGFAQALQNDQLSLDERHRYLTIIDAESTRLSKLTANLLRLGSLEAKQVRFEPKPYCLDKQIRNLILASEPQWVGKDLDMEVSLEEVTITADEELLSQVWINLLHNSIKFTPQGGRIDVQLCRQDSGVKFAIKDTGIGIPDEDKDHIFERFYKADKSRTHANNGGSGLGLSIVHKIVEMHKGTISVDSAPNAGAEFTVLLPAA